MAVSLLEVLRAIPDRRRAEGRRYELGAVVFCSILGMVAGANSYRQMHEFIRVHFEVLNDAFGLGLRGPPSYTGLRDILLNIDAEALETAFRHHASALAAPPSEGPVAVAIDGKTLRGSFDAFREHKAVHMLSALRQADQILLGHLMVDEKSNEIPAAPELIEALGLKDCLFTLDAAHAQKKPLSRRSPTAIICSRRSRTTSPSCADVSNAVRSGDVRSTSPTTGLSAEIAGRREN